MRSLFVKGLVNQTGKIDSAMYVKQRIEPLIAAESHEAPLSAKMLTETLQQEGTEISRRTVTKYREELNIVRSAKRVHLYRLNTTKEIRTKKSPSATTTAEGDFSYFECYST